MKVAEKHQKHSLWWTIQFWEIKRIAGPAKFGSKFILQCQHKIKHQSKVGVTGENHNKNHYDKWPKKATKTSSNCFSLKWNGFTTIPTKLQNRKQSFHCHIASYVKRSIFGAYLTTDRQTHKMIAITLRRQSQKTQ